MVARNAYANCRVRLRGPRRRASLRRVSSDAAPSRAAATLRRAPALSTSDRDRLAWPSARRAGPRGCVDFFPRGRTPRPASKRPCPRAGLHGLSKVSSRHGCRPSRQEQQVPCRGHNIPPQLRAWCLGRGVDHAQLAARKPFAAVHPHQQRGHSRRRDLLPMPRELVADLPRGSTPCRSWSGAADHCQDSRAGAGVPSAAIGNAAPGFIDGTGLRVSGSRIARSASSSGDERRGEAPIPHPRRRRGEHLVAPTATRRPTSTRRPRARIGPRSNRAAPAPPSPVRRRRRARARLCQLHARSAVWMPGRRQSARAASLDATRRVLDQR